MSTLADIATLDQLAAQLNLTKDAVEQLLAKHGVPVTDGVFSRRLLLARIEGRDLADEEPEGRDSQRLLMQAQRRLLAAGFQVQRMRKGRPKVLQLRVTRPMLVGPPGFPAEDDPSAAGDPFARRRFNERDELTAFLHVASHRTQGAAKFNIKLERTRGPELPEFFVFYLQSEQRLWLFTPEQLRVLGESHLREARPKARMKNATFSFNDIGGGIWRLSIGSQRIDFDAEECVEWLAQ